MNHFEQRVHMYLHQWQQESANQCFAFRQSSNLQHSSWAAVCVDTEGLLIGNSTRFLESTKKTSTHHQIEQQYSHCVVWSEIERYAEVLLIVIGIESAAVFRKAKISQSWEGNMTDSSNNASIEVEILKGPSTNIHYELDMSGILSHCWISLLISFVSSLFRQLSGKLSFLVTNDIGSIQAQNGQKSIYFTTDSTLIYTAFFADFGPLDLGLTYQFCQQLHELLKASTAAKKSVVYYCSDHLHRRANSAVLLCSYLVRPYTISIFSEIPGIFYMFCDSIKSNF